ncbi:MAG: hypothetical protein FD152_4074 [Xanthobacteraceae bacterium]|nr:MAG: hypothetical protein FD152_4074 [Xanthobacteraceae bacterium]
MSAGELVQFWSLLGENNVHPCDIAILPSNQFEIRLAPVPWAGPINTASTFILMLNPGVSSEDVPYENSRAEFARALRQNLAGDLPYLYFIRGFEDHPGHRWARGTFGWDLKASDAAIQKFVRHSLLPRARRGEVALIVARSSALWGFSGEREDQNVLIYQGSETRRAYVTSGSRGGALLRQRLAR